MKSTKTSWYSKIIKIIRIILPVLIIGAGIAFAKHLYDTKPVATRAKPVISPPLVETITLETVDHEVVISCMGKVMPSQTIALKARVGGFVTQTSEEFIPGGIYRKGDIILKLDPDDFQLAIKQQEAMLEKAQASLKLEMGKQDVARAELRLMQNTSGKTILDSNLALRVPQLEQIKADISSIKTDLERARLNLERTVIKAPFNCMVMNIYVEEGSQISSQETLATLSGIDEYRVEATVPVDHLKWIEFPLDSGDATKTTRGSDVILITRDGETRQGELIRLLGSLTDQSRLARILIRIEDPVSLKKNRKNPLLIGSYVQADIQGKVIENVFSLPRSSVRDGNKIWLVENRNVLAGNRNELVENSKDAKQSEKSVLFIKNIEILWKNSESVFIRSGVKSGQKLVISELSSPVNGMFVKMVIP
ncbi:MAG: efflux RND transporter periplasmic adaptor subunit [Desulfamplus sp.]|nr:efflux RND transporter periplasmic adaptor subunit [Desulfamplus sp.]